MKQPNLKDLAKMNIDTLMKIDEVKMIQPKSSKRIDDQNFEFIFITSSFTDPEWRSIFDSQYKDGNIKFIGSTSVLICKPTELPKHVEAIKVAMNITNVKYKEKRAQLAKMISEAQAKEKEFIINKQLEEEDVQVMFSNFKI